MLSRQYPRATLVIVARDLQERLELTLEEVRDHERKCGAVRNKARVSLITITLCRNYCAPLHP